MSTASRIPKAKGKGVEKQPQNASRIPQRTALAGAGGSKAPGPSQTSTSAVRPSRIPSASNKRPHPASTSSIPSEAEPSNPRAKKVQRIEPAHAPVASSSKPRPGPFQPEVAAGHSAGLYGMRRLPSPMRASAPIVDDAGDPIDEDDLPPITSPLPLPRTHSSPSRNHRSSVLAQRESSVKSEEENHGPPEGDAGDAMSVDEEEEEEESFSSGYDGGWIGEEMTIPTQRGSPSPELRYQRSFTKLGQRKPTPRRIILPNEGDLSEMAKTVYYEHDEDQVEAPSPSPNSRRRAVRAREREREAADHQPMRILDGLDGSRSEDEEPGQDEQGDERNDGADVSGYVYDEEEPEGFQVLEEITPNTSAEQEYSEDDDDDEGEEDAPLPSKSGPARETNGDSRPGEARNHNLGSRSPSPEEPAQPEASDTELDEDHSNLASTTFRRRFSPHHKALHDILPESHHMSSPIHSSTPRVAPRVVLQTATPRKEATPSRRQSQLAPQANEPTFSHEYLQPVSGEDDEDDDEADDDGDDLLDPDVVRVSSSNPKAAAKAAAILRMHHSYIVEDEDASRARSTSRQRPSSRNGSRTSRSRSQSRIREHVGDVSMPDLVDEVEVELSQGLPKPIARSSSPSKRNGSSHIPSTVLPHGERASHAVPATTTAGAGPSGTSVETWGKDDWRMLDRCFVQECKVVAQRLQLPSSKDVDPSHVDVDLVLERYKGLLVASGQTKSGKDWERDEVARRVRHMARYLADQQNQAREMTPNSRAQFREPATPSTFGDDYNYDGSISTSRQSSLALASGYSGLCPQLHKSRTGSASSQIGDTRADTTSLQENGPADANTSVASRLIGYLGFGRRGSATPPPADTDGPFKRPLPRASSSLRPRGDSAESSTSTHQPEMTQVRRDGPTALVEPLRRASVAPMRDPEVRVMRERESRPILRHQALPATRHTSLPYSIPIPPLQHVEGGDYVRSSYSPAPHQLRSVSSSGSVRDMIRGFEELSGEVEESIRQGTPRSRSLGATSHPRPQWSNGSSSGGSSQRSRRITQLDLTDESMEADSRVNDTFNNGDISMSFASSSIREIHLPKKKVVPATAAPHKKRMSFLGPWIS